MKPVLCSRDQALRPDDRRVAYPAPSKGERLAFGFSPMLSFHFFVIACAAVSEILT